VAEPLEQTDPSQIAGLRLVGRLGVGGMGIVYLARQASGDLVALKVIRPELSADPEFRTRFTTEVRHALSVTGPFLADVREASTSGTPQYIASVYVPGENLGLCIRRLGRLDDNEITALACALADSLSRLHEARVVHRDVKPSNIQMGPQGPILLDLGVSRSLDMSSLTKTATTLGTPAWMPPEQLQGETYGPAGDMWSWAVVVAFCAGGEHPFGLGTGESIGYRIVHEPAALPNLPEPLAGLVARALDKDPAKRPEAKEVLDVVGVGLDSVPSYVTERWSRLRVLANHHDQSVSAPTVRVRTDEQTMVALAPTRLETASAEEPTRRRGLVLAIAAVSLAVVGVLTAATLARGGDVDAASLTPSTSDSSSGSRLFPDRPAPSSPDAQPVEDASTVEAASGKPPGNGKGNGKANGKIKASKNPGKGNSKK
jgi:serine/threonine protein kinase